MTNDDIDQIVEGIEQFIISGNDDVAEIWKPYIHKLIRLKAMTNDDVEEAHRALDACGIPTQRIAPKAGGQGDVIALTLTERIRSLIALWQIERNRLTRT